MPALQIVRIGHLSANAADRGWQRTHTSFIVTQEPRQALP
jgi:hypothetical protein